MMSRVYTSYSPCMSILSPLRLSMASEWRSQNHDFGTFQTCHQKCLIQPVSQESRQSLPKVVGSGSNIKCSEERPIYPNRPRLSDFGGQIALLSTLQRLSGEYQALRGPNWAFSKGFPLKRPILGPWPYSKWPLRANFLSFFKNSFYRLLVS